MRGFVPHEPTASSPDTYSEHDLYPPVTGPHCAQSLYGCCPDGHTSATGPRNQGCSSEDCVRSRYGCCPDGATPAQGFRRTGCPEFQTPGRQFPGVDHDPNSVAPHPSETLTYVYRTGVYSECSASCDGGVQYRSVECLVQDPSPHRVVDESYCITQRLQRP
ncbi:papilin, partial [Austrofundulus limnaeus]|uniref:Papilin n=1 Tax=Austrofundulus limnaeus TaxID=52670 RepID=A0A2I4AMG1_AUSLI